MRAKLILIALFLLVSSSPGLASAPCQHLFLAGGQRSVKELEAKLESQYAEIQKLFASPPRSAGLLPADYHRRLREWQDDLAQSFVRAAATVQKILTLNPADHAMWQERLGTPRPYPPPIRSPEERKVL